MPTLATASRVLFVVHHGLAGNVWMQSLSQPCVQCHARRKLSSKRISTYPIPTTCSIKVPKAFELCGPLHVAWVWANQAWILLRVSAHEFLLRLPSKAHDVL